MKLLINHPISTFYEQLSTIYRLLLQIAPPSKDSINYVINKITLYKRFNNINNQMKLKIIDNTFSYFRKHNQPNMQLCNVLIGYVNLKLRGGWCNNIRIYKR